MQNLKAFVERKGLSIGGLLAEVEGSYGSVLCVTATGSIAAGFGNCNSDVDLMVVVDKNTVTQMPIMSYTSDMKIDSEYYFADQLQKQVEGVLLQDYPAQGKLTPQAWPQYFRALQIATRLSVSEPLMGNDYWLGIIQQCKGERLYGRVARWWIFEALRGLAGARLARQQDVRFAAFVYSDAVMALLSSRVAKQGLVLLSKKWLGEKLKRLEDKENCALYKNVLEKSCSPIISPETLCDYLDAVLSNAVELIPLIATSTYDLFLSKNTKINYFNDTIVLKKYLRGCVLNGALSSNKKIEVEAALKSFNFDEVIDDSYQQLFFNGFCWIGLTLSGSNDRN